MNYTTSLSGLILPPKPSKFLEFALRRRPILELIYLLCYPASPCSGQRHPCRSLFLTYLQSVTPTILPSSKQKFLSPNASWGHDPARCQQGDTSHLHCSRSQALSERHPDPTQAWPLHSPDHASPHPTHSAPSPQGTAPPCRGRYREHAWSPQKHTSYLQCQLGSATDGLSLITPLSVL